MTFLQKQNCMKNVMNVLKKITILLYDRFGFVINLKNSQISQTQKACIPTSKLLTLFYRAFESLKTQIRCFVATAFTSTEEKEELKGWLTSIQTLNRPISVPTIDILL